MNLSKLKRLVTREQKRLGRGHGSGKVKTSGRGQKGQKARGTIPPGFEGGQLALIKRLPFLRGKGRNKSRVAQALVLPVSALNVMTQSPVTVESLRKLSLVAPGVTRVKIVAGGTLKKALTVQLPCSLSAQKAIEAAGGRVTAL